MSIVLMKKKCVHCGKEYLYNPSVGDFGLICPKCYTNNRESNYSALVNNLCEEDKNKSARNNYDPVNLTLEY